MVAGPGPTLTAVLEHTGDPQDGAQSANIASDTEHRKRRDGLQSAGGTRLNIHEEPRNQCACVVGSVGTPLTTELCARERWRCSCLTVLELIFEFNASVVDSWQVYCVNSGRTGM